MNAVKLQPVSDIETQVCQDLPVLEEIPIC